MNTDLMSFKALAQNYTIKIPRIQRDYAQGRESAQKIRENFVRDLMGALSGGKELHLQFIYGSVKNVNEKNANKMQEFIPLDGQQRLTTLYLLHWYLAIRNEKQEDYLANFTYETRSSSREFCKALSGNMQEFSQALQEALEIIKEIKKKNPKSTKNNTILSEIIKDQAWFMPFWEQDPTIASMLTMLDSIHVKVSESASDTPLKDLYDRLDNLTFSLIELEEFGLTDELYIKMNARGAPLNDFENFKAAFENFIDKKLEDKNKTKDIATKFDNEWIKTLFEYTSNETDNINRIEIAQSYMLNTIKYLCEMLYYKNNTDEKSSFDWDKVHFNDLSESEVSKRQDSVKTKNAHSIYRIFHTQDDLGILIYTFDNFRDIQDKTAEIFTAFTESIGSSDLSKVCIFDLKEKNINDGTKLFDKMVEADKALTKQYALYLFSLIYLMKKQDERLIDKLREVRNYCEKKRSLPVGALAYKSTIDEKMGAHIAQCVEACENDVAHKNELLKRFEDSHYFKGDLRLLLGDDKASGKVSLDEADRNMLENAKKILNTEQTHTIIANLISLGFNRDFWLGSTYGRGKFLFGGKEAWHIMLSQNGRNKFDEKVAKTFRSLFTNGIKSKELDSQFKPNQWQYYFVKYSKSFFKEKHNVFVWRSGDNTLEIYRLVKHSTAEGKAVGKKPTRGALNPFLEVLESRLKEKGIEACYKPGENIQSKEHHIEVKGKCKILCENNSFAIEPLSDECKQALETLQLESSKAGYKISLTDTEDIFDTLLKHITKL